MLLRLQFSLGDVVDLPELLSLPIATKLGPRLAYARKRNIKLLLPSHARLLPELSAKQWMENKLVPLNVWLGKSDKYVCHAMGLNLEDFTR